MKLGTILWRAGLVLVVLACAGQYWLVQRTQEAAARFVARLVPHGDLHYGRLWPFPWGAARVWNLSFEPAGGLQMALRTPMGMRIDARELRICELRFGDDGNVSRIRGTLLGLRVPVPEWRAPTSESPDPASIPPPTLFDLGYTEIRGAVDFDIRYVASSGLAIVHFDATLPQMGHAVMNAQLGGTPQVFDRAPDQIMVRKLNLDFADGGLLTRYKEVSAGRARLGRPAWESAMVEALERRASKERWKWSDETANAARKVIRDSSYFHASIDPPGDIALRNVRLYAMADWPVLLGFILSTARGADAPAPLSAAATR